MKKNNNTKSGNLRKKAEELLKKEPAKAASLSSETDMLKLIHELQVHQIELEMQNEELELAKKHAEFIAKKYSELYDFAPSGYLTLTSNGNIIGLNLSGAKMLGKDRLHLTNSRFGLFVTDDTKPDFNLFLEKVFGSKASESCEVALLTTNQSPLYVHITGIAAENGEHCQVNVVDITDRRLAEEELKESETRLRDITFSTADWVWEVDEMGVYTYSSEKSIDLFGRSREEVVGRTPFDFMQPDEAKRVAAIFAQIKAKKAPIKDFENWKIGNNDELICLLTNGVPILDKKGNLKGYRGVDKDITERKKAEVTLLKTLSLTEAIINSVHNGILVVGSQGNLIRTNHKFAEMWNIPEAIITSGDDSKMLAFVLGQLEYPDEFMAKVSELYNSPDAKSFDLIRFRDGRIFERISRPMYLDGKPHGRIWSFLDVTARMIAEEKEKRHTENLAVLAHAAIKYISVSPNENIYDYTKNVLQTLTGAKYIIINSYEKDSNTLTSESFFADDTINKQIVKLLGRTVEGFSMNPDDYIITELLRKQVVPVEGGLYELGGQKIPQIICHAMEKLMKIDKIYTMGLCVGNELFGTATLLLQKDEVIENTDIVNTFINQTSAALQRKAFYETLKESERNLLESQRLAHIGSWHWNISTNTMKWSDELFRISGRDPKSITPDFTEMSICLTPESMKLRNAAIAKVLKDGEPYELDLDMVRPDGTIVNTHSRAEAKYDINGTITSLNGIIQDITERKAAEAEILRINNDLKESNASKDKFFSIIAHDLKSPFNTILGFSELLVEMVNEKNYQGVEKYANFIMQSSERAMELLMNLLDWARSQTDRMEFIPDYFDLANFIEEVAQPFDESAKQKSISLILALPNDITVFADPAMISTVMRNLISNAIKFTRPDGKISISVKKKPTELTISVADNGVGIPASAIDKLFRIDENYSTAGTNNEKGTGLGLILCKEFIEKHSGKIWVESEVGKGSIFHFTLPLKKI